MIHFSKDGQPTRVGLNITVGSNGLFPWIIFIWTWYVPSTQILTHWRLRIRTWRFAIFSSRTDTWVVMDYLIKYDQRLITRELIEDIRLHAYMNNDVTLNALLDRYRLPTRYE
jgi:hypothetical protein